MFKRFSKEEKERHLHLRIQRGQDAERLLNDPLMKQAFASIESKLIAAMRKADPKDLEGLAIAHADLRAHDRFKAAFVDYLRSGEEAKSLLKQLIG